MRLAPLALTALLALAACGDDEPAVTTAPSTSPTTAPSSTAPAGDVPAAGHAVAAVDGRTEDATACEGADGAVVAILESGDRVILVREEGLALRLVKADGRSAETAELTTTDVGGTTRYTGTITLDGTAVDLALTPSSGGDPTC